jgi:hypothetical protein
LAARELVAIRASLLMGFSDEKTILYGASMANMYHLEKHTVIYSTETVS